MTPLFRTEEFNIVIDEWSPSREIGHWEQGQYNLACEIPIDSIVNDIISKSSTLTVYDERFIESYRSYLIQSIKDCDRYISQPDLLHSIMNKSIDLTILKAQPWRYTVNFIKFSSKSLSENICSDVKGGEQIQTVFNKAAECGAIYSLDKYHKVSHVLLDIAFDAGWDSIHQKVDPLKRIEGIYDNVERTYTLREISLSFARNLLERGFINASRQLLLIGFVDIAETICSLSDTDLLKLLSKQSSEGAIQNLFNYQLELGSKNTNCNHIAEGALRLLSKLGES